MSFTTHNETSKIYAPGYFLAKNENCERKTRQINSTDSRVITVTGGGKYMPMGSIYPTNDGNAVGIVYEDVDVTTGDMPGSVVLSGTIYEDRLAITSVDYSAVTPETGDNPKDKGWYERSGEVGAYVYTLTTDTEVDSEKTYYTQTVTRMSSAAKTALEVLGFKFISEPTVTRP